MFRELPYHGVNIPASHGQCNNSLSSNHIAKNYLDKLTSLYDLDLFNLNRNPNSDINPDYNIMSNHIHSRYYSPNSFQKIDKASKSLNDNRFTFFHNNVCSLRKNLDHLQIHILDELGFSFSIIGITETRITDANIDNCNYNIPEYSFEFVPTPLAAGGVGMYINNELRYFIIEKTTNKDFQALWIEILMSNKKNIICGVLYRQHSSSECFLSYFEEKLEYFTSLGKTVVVMGDFNIQCVPKKMSL